MACEPRWASVGASETVYKKPASQPKFVIGNHYLNAAPPAKKKRRIDALDFGPRIMSVFENSLESLCTYGAVDTLESTAAMQDIKFTWYPSLFSKEDPAF